MNEKIEQLRLDIDHLAKLESEFKGLTPRYESLCMAKDALGFALANKECTLRAVYENEQI